MIDVETWAQAHGYHQRHQRLHALHWHGVGIARGLGVVANAPPDDTVVVEPGVAIDGFGHVILVSDYERVALPPEGAEAYIKLEYVERPDTDTPPGRVVEDFRIRATTTAPAGAEIELARIARGADGDSAALPASPWWSPSHGQVDLRSRRVAIAGATRSLNLVYLGIGVDDEPCDRHLEGFFYLVRAMRRSGIDVRPLVARAGDLPNADLYYVTASPGAVLPPEEAEALRDAVAAGARLLVDGCSPGEGFIDAIRAALPDLGAAPEDLEREVLRAHNVLASPPLGAAPDGDFEWHVAGPLASRDYGCAWAGLAADSVTARDALDFGVNVAAWASSPAELTGLDHPPR